MTDFDSIPNQTQQWNETISGWINDAITSEKKKLKTYPKANIQFFNVTVTAPAGVSFDQDIAWNAFPRTLVLSYGRKDAAFWVSEQLFSLTTLRPAYQQLLLFYQDLPGSTMWSELLTRPQSKINLNFYLYRCMDE